MMSQNLLQRQQYLIFKGYDSYMPIKIQVKDVVVAMKLSTKRKEATPTSGIADQCTHGFGTWFAY